MGKFLCQKGKMGIILVRLKGKTIALWFTTVQMKGTGYFRLSHTMHFILHLQTFSPCQLSLMVGISSIVEAASRGCCVQPAPAPAAPPLGKLNHKVELLCFADKTIIQTDSLHFIKISLTIFLHEFWFCSDLFYLSEKPLIYSCMRVHLTPAAAARPTNT